ncbi:MAG: YdcF family protein [Acidimicrobiia bacterium]
MIAILVVAAFCYLVVTYVQVWSTGRKDQARPVDAIVVMGAAQYDGRPSPQLAARLDHAFDLWQLGLAPIVVVTGGNQPGDRFTEAEASAAYLVERGVPSDVIVQEQQGRSSWESLANAADLFSAGGIERILLVSDPFHSLRIRLIAEELGFEAYTSPTRSSPVSGATARGREAKEAVGVAVGRIIGFERLWRLTG